MEILIKAAQLLLSLSILVVFHEFGHFAFAKLFKTKVEKFYLFFNPWFSLFKFKKGETEYGIGWIPLGGYVKIAGMIDESMDKEQLAKDPEPWEFRSKPSWQRLLIMIGGVAVNFILAIVIYVGILFAWGDDYLPAENVKYGITTNALGEEFGFKNGDKIISINDKKPEKFGNIFSEIVLSAPALVKVERDNNIVDINVPASIVAKAQDKKSRAMFTPRFPFVISKFAGIKNAENAGFLPDDRFIKADSLELQYFDEYLEFFAGKKGQKTNITFVRNNREMILPVEVSENGVIGVQVKNLELFDLEHIEYSFLEAFPAGFNKGYNKTAEYLRSLKLIFNPETKAYKSLGGFGTIGSLFPPTWDWQSFWNLTAFLSLILAVMNLLPIPALDGGHVMFLLYEMISGRKPGEKFMEYAQITGMVLLLGLLIFANGNDIFKLFN